MKIFKKLGVLLLLCNFAFLGLAQTKVSEVYAAETSEEAKYKTQKENLSFAVADSINVISTEAYNSYASSNTKMAYQKAVMDGKAVLQKGDTASFTELAVATSKINDAKSAIWRDVDRAVKIIRLKEAVEQNKVSVRSAKFLLQNAPNSVAGVKDKLINLIKKSEALIEKTEAVLQRV